MTPSLSLSAALTAPPLPGRAGPAPGRAPAGHPDDACDLLALALSGLADPGAGLSRLLDRLEGGR